MKLSVVNLLTIFTAVVRTGDSTALHEVSRRYQKKPCNDDFRPLHSLSMLKEKFGFPSSDNMLRGPSYGTSMIPNFHPSGMSSKSWNSIPLEERTTATPLSKYHYTNLFLGKPKTEPKMKALDMLKPRPFNLGYPGFSKPYVAHPQHHKTMILPKLLNRQKVNNKWGSGSNDIKMKVNPHVYKKLKSYEPSGGWKKNHGKRPHSLSSNAIGNNSPVPFILPANGASIQSMMKKFPNSLPMQQVGLLLQTYQGYESKVKPPVYFLLNPSDLSKAKELGIEADEDDMNDSDFLSLTDDEKTKLVKQLTDAPKTTEVNVIPPISTEVPKVSVGTSETTKETHTPLPEPTKEPMKDTTVESTKETTTKGGESLKALEITKAVETSKETETTKGEEVTKAALTTKGIQTTEATETTKEIETTKEPEPTEQTKVETLSPSVTTIKAKIVDETPRTTSETEAEDDYTPAPEEDVALARLKKKKGKKKGKGKKQVTIIDEETRRTETTPSPTKPDRKKWSFRPYSRSLRESEDQSSEALSSDSVPHLLDTGSTQSGTESVQDATTKGLPTTTSLVSLPNTRRRVLPSKYRTETL